MAGVWYNVNFNSRSIQKYIIMPWCLVEYFQPLLKPALWKNVLIPFRLCFSHARAQRCVSVALTSNKIWWLKYHHRTRMFMHLNGAFKKNPQAQAEPEAVEDHIHTVVRNVHWSTPKQKGRAYSRSIDYPIVDLRLTANMWWFQTKNMPMKK